MITKTKVWKIIREGLQYRHRADKTTEKVMKLIKEIPQNEDKD